MTSIKYIILPAMVLGDMFASFSPTEIGELFFRHNAIAKLEGVKGQNSC